MFLKQLFPTKITSPFMLLHNNFGIARAIHNAHNIPISLCIVRHEAFEVRMWDTMASHDVVEVLPKENLGILILRLEITTCNGHYPLKSPIIHMSGHGSPSFDSLDKIGHHLHILEVPTWLHLSNQVHSTS